MLIFHTIVCSADAVHAGLRLVDGLVAYDEFPLALTPEEEIQGYELACQAKPERDLVISSASTQAEMPCAYHHSAIVHAVKRVSSLVTSSF
jgi:CDP-4-dehydro-6-deoxyglucose reductase, E3